MKHFLGIGLGIVGIVLWGLKSVAFSKALPLGLGLGLGIVLWGLKSEAVYKVKPFRFRFRYSVSDSVRNRQPGIVLWGLKSEEILGARKFFRYRYSVSYSVRSRQPGIVLWGLKSECILGASVFRFRDRVRVRDSTLGAKKRVYFRSECI